MTMDLTRHLSPFALTIVSAFCIVGCALGPNHTSRLENDELYLDRNEEYITDAQYLASAYESSSESINNVDNWSGSGMSYGMGYGYGSLGGYGGYGMNNGWGNGMNNGWGGNNFYGYDPFNSGYYGYGGYNPYGYSPFGCSYYGYGNSWGNGYGNGNGWNNGWMNWGGGNDVYTTSTLIIKPRTPLSTNVLTNSNYSGRRIESNKIDRVDSHQNLNQVQKRHNSNTRTSTWGNSSNIRSNNPSWNNNGSNSRNNSNWGSGSSQPSNNGRSNVGSSRPSSRPSTTRSSREKPPSGRPSGGRR